MSPTPFSVGRTSVGRGSAAGTRSDALALVAVVGAILVLTLWPLGARPAFDDDRFTLRFNLADGVRNLILFLPLGIALSRRGAGFAGVLLRAALFSSSIEIAQVFIPGRYGNVVDVLSNAGGALLGAALQRAGSRLLWPSRPGAQQLALAWSAAIMLAILATAVLLGPTLPATEYYAGRTPELGHLAQYTGHVTSASLGDEALEDGRLPDSAAVRRLWLDGAPLRVSLSAGAPTHSLAPIFTIHDAAHREILLLGAERGDLVLRVRTWAQAVSLDRPAMRWPGILDSVREGQPLSIAARRDGNGWCLWLDGRSSCPLGFTAGSGWRLIWFPQILPAETAPWLSAVWLAMLFLPLGLWLRAGLAGALAAALAASALFAAPQAGLLATPAAEIGASLAGLALGAVLRSRLERSRPRSRLVLGSGGTLPLP